MLATTVAIRRSNTGGITGSGVILRYRKGERIVILTAKHVSVHLNHEMYISTQAGNYKNNIPAHTIRDSGLVDIALLVSNEVSPIDGPEASLATNEPEVGNELYIVGCPNGHLYNISKGILSSIFYEGDSGERYYRTDAAVYFGNSGGPVFNADGRLVGITVAIEAEKDAVVPGSGMLVTLPDLLSFCYGTLSKTQ